MKSLLLLCIALAAPGLSACAGRSHFKEVEFRAPSPPDPALAPLLRGVERIGVICVTNIEPFRELDVEKVLTLLANAVARGLGRLPEVAVVPQDEITWELKGVHFDSTSIDADSVQAALREELRLDALVFVELRNLQARMMPMTPTPYGLSPSPGMDLSVDLRVRLVNLHTRQSWQDSGEERHFEPVRLQVLGTSNQTERQLLVALARPMQRFLARVAPPPHPQTRLFELGGD